MKIIIKVSLSIVMVALMGACSRDDFNDINTDPKNLTVNDVTAAEFPLFVKRSLISAYYMTPKASGWGVGPFQVIHSLFNDFYAQYFSCVQERFDSDRMVLVGGWINGGYKRTMERAAPNIKISEDLSESLGFEVENAIMKIWRVNFYQRLTDMWGPIPYSEFGNGTNSVPYDSQEAIYMDFFNTLDEAVSVLKAHAGETSFIGTNDVVYGGSVDSWLKLANSFRLRLAVRIKYVDGAKAKLEAEKAVADGVMLLNTDNAYVHTNDLYRHPYTVISRWREYRASADMESILKGYRDPRVQDYLSEAEIPDPLDDPEGLTFNWEGLRNGQSKVAVTPKSVDVENSNMAIEYITPGPGPDFQIMNAAEVYFLRAEGAMEGWDMGGTVQELYEAGILTSLGEYGYSGNDLSGNDYISSTNVPASYDGITPAVSTVPIAFDNGASNERKLEQIITQKWIALYPNSEEAWTERRRTGYPILYPRILSDNPDIAVDEIPTRLTYPELEYSTNADAVTDAVANLLGGPDSGTTKLWWDKKN